MQDSIPVALHSTVECVICHSTQEKTFFCLSLGDSKINFFCCRKQVAASRLDAERDGVVVPTTMEEYCMKAKPPQSPQENIDMDFYDDDCYDMDEDEEEDDDGLDDDDDDDANDAAANHDDDSGNGES